MLSMALSATDQDTLRYLPSPVALALAVQQPMLADLQIDMTRPRVTSERRRRVPDHQPACNPSVTTTEVRSNSWVKYNLCAFGVQQSCCSISLRCLFWLLTGHWRSVNERPAAVFLTGHRSRPSGSPRPRQEFLGGSACMDEAKFVTRDLLQKVFGNCREITRQVMLED